LHVKVPTANQAVFLLFMQVELEHQPKEYNLQTLEKAADALHIQLYPDIAGATARVRETAEKKMKDLKAIPAELKTDDRLRMAASLYHELLKPSIPENVDTKLSPEAVVDLVQKIARPEGANLVLYLGVTKTLSPTRTGSPNALIDLAELEALKYFSTLTGTAKELGFKLGVVIVDESAELIDEPALGVTPQQRAINQDIISSYLRKAGSANEIQIRSLRDSLRTPLGNKFDELHKARYDAHKQIIHTDLERITTGDIDIRQNRSLKETFVFFECLSDESLKSMGLDQQEVEQIRQNVTTPLDLLKLPTSVLNYVIHLTCHMEAALGMRDLASQHVSEDELHKYPEYDVRTKITTGITRREGRLSLLAVPQKYKGRTVLPMHGLAIYDGNGSFKGFIPHEVAKREGMEIVYHGSKPISVLLQ
jgi:hypothetical protein